jgi:hypothetical protein
VTPDEGQGGSAEGEPAEEKPVEKPACKPVRRQPYGLYPRRWWHRPPSRRPKAAGPASVEDVEKELGKALARSRWIDVGIRKWLGYGSLGVLAAQLAVADVAFFIYGYHKGWKIPASAIEIWLGAVVVQLFIVVQGIGTYLFPGEDSPHKE